MKKYKKRGLVWKLTCMISFLLLITTMLICVIYIRTFYHTFLEEAEDQLQVSLTTMQNNIDESLDDADSILNELFYGRAFPYFLDAENILSDNEMQYYVSNLGKDLGNAKYLYNNKYSDIGIYSSNQQISEQQYEWQFYLDDLKKKPYYSEIINDTGKNESVYGKVRERGLISSTLNTENLKMGDSGIRILPVYRTVSPQDSTNLIGVVEMDIDVARLADKDGLAGEENEIGKMLMDSDGNVLFDTMTLNEEEEEQIVTAVSHDNNHDNVELKGESFMLAASTCPRTGLISVAFSSKEEFTSYITTQVIQIILIAAICGGVLVAITFFFVKNTLKRLVILDQMMGRVGEGDFTVEILGDSSEDEITRITQSFNKMASQLNDVIKEKVKNEQAQKDAELRALQAQINPHFLHNTLENMRMQCELDEYYTISDSLSALSNLFRYSIRWGNNEAPFQMEWQNLEDYLNIMKMRFDDDIEYDLYCQPGLEEIIVPKMVLQPLVENCFNHGFKKKLPPWKLEVKAVKCNDKLRIVILDNGIGMNQERLLRLQCCLMENRPFRNEELNKNSIGVTNVKQRISMICKEGSSIKVESTEGAGTRIEIIIVY